MALKSTSKRSKHSLRKVRKMLYLIGIKLEKLDSFILSNSKVIVCDIQNKSNLISSIKSKIEYVKYFLEKLRTGSRRKKLITKLSNLLNSDVFKELEDLIIDTKNFYVIGQTGISTGMANQALRDVQKIIRPINVISKYIG